jgi:iron(III) transport system permease protein
VHQVLTRKMPYWRVVAYGSAALVLMPLLVLLISWQSIDTVIWGHLLQTQMLQLIGNTLMLVAGVGAGVILLGVSLGWLTSMCEFPGRRWLDWALMLPFAIPAYVLAFVMIGLLDFAGPLQTLLRSWLGSDFRMVSIRSTGGVIIVLVLVFYPYVYLLARSAFMAQGRGLMEAARVLGQTPWQGFTKIALPMARPAIGAGAALAIMETLADFGAVSVFNYDTFTTAIYKTWYGFFSLQTATQLASVLLLFVFLALFAERRAQGSRRFPGVDRPRPGAIYRLRGPKALLASGYRYSADLLVDRGWYGSSGQSLLVTHTQYLVIGCNGRGTDRESGGFARAFQAVAADTAYTDCRRRRESGVRTARFGARGWYHVCLQLDR